MTVMTIAEAAIELGISPRTVYQICSAGRLAHIRVGLGRGIIRILRADLDAYIASTRVEVREPERAKPRPAYNGPRAKETHGL